MKGCFGLIQNSLSYFQKTYKHKKAFGLEFLETENLKLSNLFEDFYIVVDLFEYIVNNPLFSL